MRSNSTTAAQKTLAVSCLRRPPYRTGLTERRTSVFLVMYIPAVPHTPFNAAYIEKQKTAFLKGVPPPDYPQAGAEDGFAGIGKLDDITGPLGLEAMGFQTAVVG